ncbi:hypothetical protein [Chondrinema litorale]|uniref:hypothetical protein n=1 Tax=Chondrinema litorale TaxID=2994555 RepID=UPI0025432E97|nr:hypothetical protein [Chondrinema litorale]UZR93335.1 hypothetical protein OQ292_15885 [Chondrinema litorale]
MDFALLNYLDKNTLHVKISPILPTTEEFNNYLEKLTSLVKNSEDLYLLVDTTYASYLPSELRKLQADWITDNKELIKKVIIMTVHVIPDAIQRSIFNAIFLIQKPVVPYKVVPDIKTAIEIMDISKSSKKVA